MPPHVILISNDLVPGHGLPVAAPGLRVYGLAEGLRSHEVSVEVALVRDIVERQWRGLAPPASARGTVSIKSSDLTRYLKNRAPAVVILTNSNQVPYLEPIEGIRFVLDFFAPKMLELAYQYEDQFPSDELAHLRQRKLDAIRLADAFIVNGPKKLPYFLAWMLQVDRDIRQLPVEVVNMCIPIVEDPIVEPNDPRRFGVAGYLQGWSTPGPWLDVVLEGLAPEKAVLELLLPAHWGQPDGDRLGGPELERAVSHPAVSSREAMTYSSFRQLVSSFDVAIDLFSHTLEREYAVVTRTVVALSCGVPVIHPPFTEVAAWIDEYDAGWLVDPDDLTQLHKTMQAVIDDPELVRIKRQNAHRLAAERIDPTVAVRPLVRLIEEIA